MARSASAAPIAIVEDYQWLFGPQAAGLLGLAASWQAPTAAQVANLRRHCSPAKARLVLDQAALRLRGKAKFAAADRMFFTARLLEQASDEIVAAYKARKFQGSRSIFDLCCGMGGDLLALASHGEVVGLDRDPIAVSVARANLAVVQGASGDGGAQSRVEARDAREVDTADCTAWHIDPDRRPRGFRTTHVDLHEPPTEVIESLLGRNPNAAIKLAPAARMDESWSDRASLEWISRDGQCRQLVAWFGDLAPQPGRRWATILNRTATPPRTVIGIEQTDPPVAAKIGRYVFEPDAAVLAAKLSGALAAEHELEAVSGGTAYWTGDRAIDDPALACFEVLEVLPLRVSRLKQLLRQRGVGRLEIKKRGIECDPASLRRRLQLAGRGEATLLATRVAGRATAIVARRLTSAHQTDPSGTEPAT